MPETLDTPLRPATPATSPQVGRSEKIRVLSVLVEDGPNTLTKVSGAIRRRGFHVTGISVGPSRKPGLSRITLHVDHGHAEADQVRKQLERLVEVIEVEDVTADELHSRELVIAKVETKAVEALVQRGAKVLSKHNGTTTVEFSGERDEVRDFVAELESHGIVDVIRSGPVVMRRQS